MSLKEFSWSYKDTEYYPSRGARSSDSLLFNLQMNKFKKMAISTYKWFYDKEPIFDNIEKILFDDYQAILYDFPEYGLMVAKCQITGWDMYGEPLTIKPILPDKKPYRDLSIDECVLITDSQIYGSGRKDSIAYWTDKYVDIQVTIDTQTINQRTPMLMLASSPKDVEKLRSIVLDTMTGAKALVIEPQLKDAVIPLNFNAPFNVDALIQIQKTYENRILENLGIDNLQAFGKKERLIVDEQESNDESLGVILEDGLTARRKASAKILALYGLEVPVDVLRPTRIVSETDTGDGEIEEEREETEEKEND